MTSTVPRWRPWLAALLSLLCPGLGLLYAGRPRAGLLVYALAFGLSAAASGALALGVAATIAGFAAVLAFTIGQAVVAARAARMPPAPVPWYARPLALAGLLVVAGGIWEAARDLRRSLLPHVASMSGSMFPGLITGDHFVVLPAGSIGRGTVVVHAAPRGLGRPVPLAKRVVGVAGDVVEVRDGQLVLNGVPAGRERVEGPCRYEARAEDGTWREEPCVHFRETLDGRRYGIYCTPYLACGDVPPQRVPPGHVFVLGDHRDHSADSRVYGPVPVQSILGRASYVFVSFGPKGLRWDRVGVPVP